MNQPLVTIQRPGLQSSFQDEGRQRSLHWGVGQGGVLDPVAAKWAWYLSHQVPGSPLVEIIGGGTEWYIQHTLWLIITGADLQAQWWRENEQRWMDLSPYVRIHMKTGDRLVFRGSRCGWVAYVAVLGQWQCRHRLGSASCVVRESETALLPTASTAGAGTLRPFLAGDVLWATLDATQRPEWARMPIRMQQLNVAILGRDSPWVDLDQAVIPIPFFPTSQWFWFDEKVRQQFLTQRYRISSQSNRMGIRCDGEQALSLPQGLSTLSEPIALGAIQCPANGQPIVLMNDHQSLGGYPKLGTVTRWGRHLLAQARPHQSVRFYDVRDMVFSPDIS